MKVAPLPIAPIPLEFPSDKPLKKLLDTLYIGPKVIKYRDTLQIGGSGDKDMWVIRLERCDSGHEIAYCNRLMCDGGLSAHLQLLLNSPESEEIYYYRYNIAKYAFKTTVLNDSDAIKILQEAITRIKHSFYRAIGKLNSPYYRKFREIEKRYGAETDKWRSEQWINRHREL